MKWNLSPSSYPCSAKILRNLPPTNSSFGLKWNRRNIELDSREGGIYYASISESYSNRETSGKAKSKFKFTRPGFIHEFVLFFCFVPRSLPKPSMILFLRLQPLISKWKISIQSQLVEMKFEANSYPCSAKILRNWLPTNSSFRLKWNRRNNELDSRLGGIDHASISESNCNRETSGKVKSKFKFTRPGFIQEMVIFRCFVVSSFLRPSTIWCRRLQALISIWQISILIQLVEMKFEAKFLSMFS